MSWKKKQLIQMAYGSFGLTQFAFSLTPEMIENGLMTLDAMMARWATQMGIRIGYNGATNPGDSNSDTASGIPDHANEAVYLGLGKLLAKQVGKMQDAETATSRDNAFDSLLSWCQASQIPSMQFRRNTPVGAGNKPEQNGVVGVFFQPAGQLEAGPDSFLDGQDGTPLLDGTGTPTVP